MRIGVDLDGCLFDFHKSLMSYLDTIEHNWSINGKDEPKDWNFYRAWGMADDEFVNTCNAGVDAGLVFRGNIHPGGAEAIQAIKGMGHSIHIITDRRFGTTPEASERATIEWLEEHNIPYDTITFSPDKTSVETDIMVEDKLENYDALVANGTLALLIDRPWNQDSSVNRNRIANITDFAQVVGILSGLTVSV